MSLTKPTTAEAISQVAAALHRIAAAIEQLGTNGANTNMGALELLSLSTKEGMSGIAEAIKYGKANPDAAPWE